LANRYEKDENRFSMIGFSLRMKEVHPGDLKNAVIKYLNELLEPIRKDFESEEMQKLILNAYPPPAPVQQKKSKKNKLIEVFEKTKSVLALFSRIYRRIVVFL